MKTLLPVLLLCAAHAFAGEAPWFIDPVARLGGQLVQLDAPEPVSMDVGAVFGDEPMTFQWLRDGKQVRGATGRTLSLDAVTRHDAGVYSVVVSNHFGKATSGEFFLVVVGSKATRTVTLKQPGRVVLSVPNVWGPATFDWVVDDARLPRPWSTINTLGNGPSAVLDQFFDNINAFTLTANVSVDVGGYTLPPIPATDFAVTVQRPPVIMTWYLQSSYEFPLGAPVDVMIPVARAEIELGILPLPDLRLVNAPPGLELKQVLTEYGATYWRLVGRPTRAGNYDSLLISSNDVGEVRTPVNITVSAWTYQPGLPGTPKMPWNKRISHCAGLVMDGAEAKGVLALDIATNGALTGKLLFDDQVFPLAAELTTDIVWKIPMPQFGDDVLLLLSCDGVAVYYSLGEDGKQALATGYLLPSSWKWRAFPRGSTGRYHATWTAANQLALATLNVSAKGDAMLVHKLSDGTVATVSAPLDDGGVLLVYQRPYAGKGLLLGQLQVYFPDAAASVPLDGTLRWKRPADVRFNKAIDTQLVTAKASRYRQARSDEAFLGYDERASNADLHASIANVSTDSLPAHLSILRDGRGLVPGDNPSGFKLYINPQTGDTLAHFVLHDAGAANRDVWASGFVIGAHGSNAPAEVYLTATTTALPGATDAGTQVPMTLMIQRTTSAPPPILAASVAAQDTSGTDEIVGTEAEPVHITVLEGRNLKLKTRAKLKQGEHIQWRVHSPLSDVGPLFIPFTTTEDVIGPRTRTLELRHVPSIANGAAIVADFIADDQTERRVATYVLDVAVPPTLTLQTFLPFHLGARVYEGLVVTVDEMHLSARDLPPGLILKPATADEFGVTKGMWEITGIPRSVGVFHPSITFSNAAGSNTVSVTMSVVPVPPHMVGTFYGLITETSDGSIPSGGSIVLTLTRAGVFSGVVTTMAGRQAIAGRFDDTFSVYPFRSTRVSLKPLIGMAKPTLELSVDPNTGIVGRVFGPPNEAGARAEAGVGLDRVRAVKPERTHALLEVYQNQAPPGLAVFDSPGGPDANVVIRLDKRVITSKAMHVVSVDGVWLNTTIYGLVRAGHEAVSGTLEGNNFGYFAHTVRPTAALPDGISIGYEIFGSLWEPMRDDSILLDLPYTTPNALFDNSPASLKPGQTDFAANLNDPYDSFPVAWTMKLNRKLGTFTATRSSWLGTTRYFGLVLPGLKMAVGMDWSPPATISDKPATLEIKAVE